jgi:cell division transport system ATP-binding protein
MIKIDKITKKYGGKKVLDEISFEVDGGELVSVVGASGAGKSSLMHALIGAIKVDKGTITVDDYEVTSLKSADIQEYRRRIGIVFQDYKLLPKKTVFENVAFALEVAGYDKAFIHQRTVSVLKLTGLEDLRNNFPHQLSGGEQQRTAIARALVHAPELLFADEPTGNLDPENTDSLVKLFLKINETGTTVILATHNKEIVDKIKRRVVKLDNGKVVSDKNNAGYN